MRAGEVCKECGSRTDGYSTYAVGSPGRMRTRHVCRRCGATRTEEGIIDIVDGHMVPIDLDWVSDDGVWFISYEDDPSYFDGTEDHGRCVSLVFVGNADYYSYTGLFEDGTVLETMFGSGTIDGPDPDMSEEVRRQAFASLGRVR